MSNAAAKALRGGQRVARAIDDERLWKWGGKGGYVALVTMHSVEFIEPTQALEAPHGSKMVS